MGVPALFRWLSQKYPKIISPVIEESPRDINGEEIPVDHTKPNPNGEEFDNLYLDMNGIVHPCSHPEDRPPPSTEADMMLEVFKYTDRVVNMVRPRKVLMIAVDGVAPRAKMNQQRSRRFRSAQEAKEKDEEKAEFMKMLKQQNGGVLPEHLLKEGEKKTWDSNAITPGTPFMDILALSLRYWVAYKLNSDPAWAKLKIIISDATVPGEGEHKIMEFVRSQRASTGHDPNTRHVIYGLDADLIMLGLATHEPHFRVLREDVFFQDSKPRTCHICGQTGHKADECRGEAKQKSGEFDEKGSVPQKKPFIWLHVGILREYLAVEMDVPNQGFRMDLERAIDDWIFMCFFVGNDFLPHLPSLDIREQGIDTLIAIWRDNLPIMGGYVTKDGHVDFTRCQHILAGLAKQEDAIFKRRKEEEDRKEANQKRRQQNEERHSKQPRRSGGDSIKLQSGDFNLVNLDSLQKNQLFKNGDQKAQGMTHDMMVNQAKQDVAAANNANKSAAALLKEKMNASKAPVGNAEEAAAPATPNGHAAATNGQSDGTPASGSNKRKREMIDEADQGTPGRNSPDPAAKKEGENPEAPGDNVRMWEEGYRDRYYSQKFHVGPENQDFRHQVARDYAMGLQWVLLYYFQGCPSWTWYYPHHYAPFAADFVDLASLEPKFDLGKPFKPYEQLMGVMPAASNHTIPEPFHELMTSEDSDIVHFYPEQFPIDLNGKKWAWQGVALLPFIDEKLLLDAMNTKYPLLSEAEHKRNSMGKEALYFSEHHPLYEAVAPVFFGKKQGVDKWQLKPSISEGLSGKVVKNEEFMPLGSLDFPLEEGGMPRLAEDHSITVHYEMPKSRNIHKSMILNGVKFNTPALNNEDKAMVFDKAKRSGRSHGGVPFRGGRGGGRGRGRGGGGIDYSSDRHNGGSNGQPDNRPNPFAAHLNPAFFPGGIPPPGFNAPPPQFAYGGQPPPVMPPQQYGPPGGYGGYNNSYRPPPPAQGYQRGGYSGSGGYGGPYHNGGGGQGYGRGGHGRY